MKAHTPPKKRHIWLVGGGTFGHVAPLLAVAEVLKKDKHVQLTYIGDKNGREVTASEQYHIPFVAVPSGKFRRYLTVSSFLLNLRDLVLLVAGVVKSYILIRRHRPNLVFSKGGPVALPVAIAAYIAGVPVVTHESDAVIGRANRLIARIARVILTGFPANVYPAEYAKKITHVGLPLRSDFLTHTKRVSHTQRPMVLVTGGSQGAVAINEAIGAILPQLLEHASVMHITGTVSYERFQALREELPRHLAEYYGVIDFTSEIAQFMREATVIVMRAGSQIFEAATLGKPMLLIPLPSAANNHQLRNAEYFVRYGAAEMLVQDNLTPDRLYETISSLLKSPARLRELREGTRTFASADAASRVAVLLKEYAER